MLRARGAYHFVCLPSLGRACHNRTLGAASVAIVLRICSFTPQPSLSEVRQRCLRLSFNDVGT